MLIIDWVLDTIQLIFIGVSVLWVVILTYDLAEWLAAKFGKNKKSMFHTLVLVWAICFCVWATYHLVGMGSC